MKSISFLQDFDSEIFRSKKVQQIVSFLGEGQLKDGNKTSKEFRQLLDGIPVELLNKYADECLIDKFDGSGYVLQDIVNQIGIRLGFSVIHGRYKGVRNDIGFDGIWTSIDNYSIVIEVKTTDVYSINLDDVAKYRTQLIAQNHISDDNSSILIVVGRIDTGGLEAQILGSRHYRHIRLVSVDVLFRLLYFKEQLKSDIVINHVNSLFRPFEYTRVDNLIDLVCFTAKEFVNNLNFDEVLYDNKSEIEPIEKKGKSSNNLYEECLQILSSHLKTSFTKVSQISFKSLGDRFRIILSASKEYPFAHNSIKYWFSLYPKHIDFLEGAENSYLSLCCGTESDLFLIPLKDIKPLLPYLTTSTKKSVTYWHIIIYIKNGEFIFRVPKNNTDINLAKYRVQ